jgi:shikimate dehydrogenase
VRYDRLVPRLMGQDFDAVFDHCAQAGYRGINITYPYKERVTARLTIPDPLVRAMGAVNTVLFDPGARRGTTPTTPGSSPPTGRRAAMQQQGRCV